MIERGDIYWLDLSDHKKRPVVVVSPDFLNDVRERIIMAPCTSRRTDEVTRTEVLLDHEGLPKRTKVQCQDIGTFSRRHLGERIRALNSRELSALEEALLIVTGLWD